MILKSSIPQTCLCVQSQFKSNVLRHPQKLLFNSQMLCIPSLVQAVQNYIRKEPFLCAGDVIVFVLCLFPKISLSSTTDRLACILRSFSKEEDVNFGAVRKSNDQKCCQLLLYLDSIIPYNNSDNGNDTGTVVFLTALQNCFSCLSLLSFFPHQPHLRTLPTHFARLFCSVPTYLIRYSTQLDMHSTHDICSAVLCFVNDDESFVLWNLKQYKSTTGKFHTLHFSFSPHSNSYISTCIGWLQLVMHSFMWNFHFRFLYSSLNKLLTALPGFYPKHQSKPLSRSLFKCLNSHYTLLVYLQIDTLNSMQHQTVRN